jgi:hypothetical protein
MVDYRITAAERTRFKRSRRQWDFASPHRRNLRSSGVVEPALPAQDRTRNRCCRPIFSGAHEVSKPRLGQSTWVRPRRRTAAMVIAAPGRALDCRRFALDVQADVEHPHRMRERPDCEVVHSGPGVVRSGVE